MLLHQLLPWFLIVLLVVVGSSVSWERSRPESPSASDLTTSEAAVEPPAPSQPTTKQATTADLQQTIKDLLSAHEQDEGQIRDLQRQLSTEKDRVNGFAKRLEGLEDAHAEDIVHPRRHRR